MNKWIQEMNSDNALELLSDRNTAGDDAFFSVWLAEVDKIISNDGIGESHSELPDWGWHEAYSAMDLTPAEAVSSYLVDQTNMLLESFIVFTD
ncbi:MAG: hypothetical protein H9W81_01185 [Enterococcus sp.]|nr:hypothetical protein [Enterococcus sp.]